MSRHAEWRLAVLLACASLLASLLLPATASATHHGEGVVDVVVMELRYRSSSLAGAPGQLVARLVLDDGSPLAGAAVEFWREVEFLGSGRVLLGRATTGTDGSAGVPLSQSESALRVGARFAGGESYLAAEQAIDISAPAMPLPPSTAPAGEGGGARLGVVSAVMPLLLVLTAIAVWLLLIGIIVTTVLAIRRGRPSPRQEDTR